MSDLPDGLVTFLFTDVQGSTRMWEESPDLMMRALEQHDEAIDAAVDAHGGVSVKPRGEGDSRFVVFDDAMNSVAAVAEMQRKLAATDWATPQPILVRAALHTGTADLQLGDYYGSSVNRAARIRAIAHGGQTIMSRSTWELVQDQLPDGVSIRDLGEHGLKDLTRPENVFQIDIDGLPDSFPPLTSLDAISNNLPLQLTDFVGREKELREAKRLLAENRLLTILAPGGSGKSRLAIQAAADLIGDYPDGGFFIELASIDSSGEIVQTVAEALGIGLSSEEDVEEQLLTYLANKTQLLVFDNFEHVMDGVPIISAILKGAANVTVLATSRTKLNLTGETTLSLSGLETTWDTPEQAFQVGGVQLFIDAAERVKPGFSLEEDDLEPLAEILRLTGGSPLGILLAAAWADMLPVHEIAEEISKSLDFLETEAGDVPDRQRSVRAVFEYTWALLSVDERSIFVALSVFRGGFTREAAQQVAGASLRNLANLANKSLVTPSPDTGRYAVHELLRQFAQAELEADPDRCSEVLDAHAGYYGSVADEAFELLSSADHVRLVAVMEEDIENIRVAWRHHLGKGHGAAIRTLAVGLWVVYEFRGWHHAAVSLFGEAADALLPGSDDQTNVDALALSAAIQAWFLGLVGQPDTGAATATRAIDTLRSSDDLVAKWLANQSAALCLGYLGKADEMIERCEEGLAIAETIGHPFWAAAMKSWRSFAAVVSGDLEMAKRLLPEGFEALTRLNEHLYLTWNLWSQGGIARSEGRFADAIDLHSRQVSLSQEAGYLRASFVALEGLGDASLAARQLEQAEAAYLEGLAATDQMSMVPEMLGMMTKVARVRAAAGRHAEAVELLATVLAEPNSAQQQLTDNTPINELASEALSEVQKEIDPEEYGAARARGTSTPFEVAAKEMLSSRSRIS